MKEIGAEKQAVYNSNYHHRQMETNHDEHIEDMVERVRKSRAQNPEKYRAQENENRKQHRVKKTYHCALCKTSCQSKADLDIHNETEKHRRQAANLRKPHKCHPCAYGTDKLSNFNDHLQSKRHQKNVAALSSSELD